MKQSVTTLPNGKATTTDNVKSWLEEKGFVVTILGRNNFITALLAEKGNESFKVVVYGSYVVFPASLQKVFT